MCWLFLPDCPCCQIHPKADNQVYNSIVQGMQTEIPASFHSEAPEFLFAATNQTDSVSISAASALAIH